MSIRFDTGEMVADNIIWNDDMACCPYYGDTSKHPYSTHGFLTQSIDDFVNTDTAYADK